MGTPGHMQHPFDIPEVKTGYDLIQYFEKIANHIKANAPSLKFDGINVSFKLVDDETKPNGKDFRMDRGTSHTESVAGMTAADAYEKWPSGHGMPPAIEVLLKIFNEAMPQITTELKQLGMWDDPTKFFNTEYMKKGVTNVVEYKEPILAIHGINQFYEKKAQAWRVARGQSMDRPGLPRPSGVDAGSTEIPYNKQILASLIEKVEPIASKHGFTLVGDVSANLISDVDFSQALNTTFPIAISRGNIEDRTLQQWLDSAVNPVHGPGGHETVATTAGKSIWAISKEVYVTVLNKIPLDEFLLSPEEDLQTAISGAVFNHATRLLGNSIKTAMETRFGNTVDHEGLVIRGLESRPVKVTGDFIVQGLGTTFRESVDKIVARAISIIRENVTLPEEQEKLVLRKIMGYDDVDITHIGKSLTIEQKRTITTLIKEREDITGKPIYIVESELEDEMDKLPKADLEGYSTVALVPGGFKPPHIGHFEMVKEFASKADMVFIIMGSGGASPRKINDKTVTFEDSSAIWEMYLEDAGIGNYAIIEVENGEVSRVSDKKASPMQIAYDIMQLDTHPKQTVIMGASSKDAGRFKGTAEKYVPKDESGHPIINLEVEEFPAYVIPGIGEASASIMRNLIEQNDLDKFKQMIPDSSRKRADEIWNLLSGDATYMKEKKTLEVSQLFSLVEDIFDELQPNPTVIMEGMTMLENKTKVSKTEELEFDEAELEQIVNEINWPKWLPKVKVNVNWGSDVTGYPSMPPPPPDTKKNFWPYAKPEDMLDDSSWLERVIKSLSDEEDKAPYVRKPYDPYGTRRKQPEREPTPAELEKKAKDERSQEIQKKKEAERAARKAKKRKEMGIEEGAADLVSTVLDMVTKRSWRTLGTKHPLYAVFDKAEDSDLERVMSLYGHTGGARMEEEELDEVSAVGGGAVEAGAGKKIKRNSIIRTN